MVDCVDVPATLGISGIVDSVLASCRGEARDGEAGMAKQLEPESISSMMLAGEVNAVDRSKLSSD